MSTAKLFQSDFYLALESLRNDAGEPADTGRRFERLMRRASKTHPYEYGPARFKNVWMWFDWGCWPPLLTCTSVRVSEGGSTF